MPEAAQDARQPLARIEEVHEVLHGVEIVDPYRWLEDSASAETRAWLADEDAHTRSVLDALAGTRCAAPAPGSAAASGHGQPTGRS